MASITTLNAKNLETLGAERLAALLIEISTGSAAAKRRLRLELAGTAGPAEAARAIAKRLASILKAKTYLDWQKVKPLAIDLEAQHRAILDHVAAADPREGFALLWRLMTCADAVFARTDDGSGRLMAVFHKAAADLAPLARAAKIAPAALADRAFDALRDDVHGQWDDLVVILAPVLGAAGLERLKAAVRAWQAEPVVTPPADERRAIGWSPAGPVYADQIARSHRQHVAATILQDIAEVAGDVDGYIAQYDAQARRLPGAATDIALRLLGAGRAEEALAALDRFPADARDDAPAEWEQARIAIFEALGRGEAAQAYRWERFAATLNPLHLRAFLRKLPDFEDFEAEQRAITHAFGFPDAGRALAFLIGWPALDRASRLVIERIADLGGERHDLLAPAAEALAAKYPLAATLLYRRMIDATLGYNRSSRYRQAAQHLAECAALAGRIDGPLPGHADYEQHLRTIHGRKWGFWQEVDAA